MSEAYPALGPRLVTTQAMLKKSISQMEIGNDSGASIVVTEMLNSFAGIWSKMIADLTNL